MKISQIPSTLVLFVFALVSIIAQHPTDNNTQLPQMTGEKWREDLRFMAAELPKVHKNLFHTMTRDEFESSVRQLNSNIPVLADHEVAIELMKIVAKIGDGHTGIRTAPVIAANGVFPLRFYLYEDGLFVQRAAPEYKDIIGGKVVRVGDLAADDALERVKSIVWRDNNMGVKDLGPFFMSSPQVLHALKISKSLEKVPITVRKDGSEKTVEVRPTGKLADINFTATTLTDSFDPNSPKPLWLKNPGDNFWFEFLPDTKILYVQFNAVQNKQNETVEAFFNRVFDFAEKNPVEKLIIDMRSNGGGNNYLNLPITIGAIKSKLNVRGKFFVIIGRETFSAAQNTVNELEKYTNAIFVGEPTAATPNHFGDAANIVLPNSKLTVRASTLWWQDMDGRDTRRWKAPDIAADLTSEHYKNGRDPAMEAILNYKRAQSLDEIIAEQRTRQNVPEFIKKYREFKANPLHKYAETEGTLNRVGYFLLGANRTDEAIEIFKLNVEAYPASANVYDSRGEAYLKKGDKARALENYEKALKIDPRFRSALAAIQQIRQTN